MNKRREGERGNAIENNDETPVPRGLGNIGLYQKLPILVQTFLRELKISESNGLTAFHTLAEAYRHLENLCLADREFALWCRKTPDANMPPSSVEPPRLRDHLFEEIFDAYFSATFPTLKRDYRNLCGIYDTETKRVAVQFRFEYFFRVCYIAKPQLFSLLKFGGSSKNELASGIGAYMITNAGKFFAAFLVHIEPSVLRPFFVFWKFGTSQYDLRGIDLAQSGLEYLLKDFKTTDRNIPFDNLLRADGTIFDNRHIADVLLPLEQPQAETILQTQAAAATFRYLYERTSDAEIWDYAFIAVRLHGVPKLPFLLLAYELHRRNLLTGDDEVAVAKRITAYDVIPSNRTIDITREVNWLYLTLATRLSRFDEETFATVTRYFFRNFEVLKQMFKNTRGYYMWEKTFGDYYSSYEWRGKNQPKPSNLPRFNFPRISSPEPSLEIAIWVLRQLDAEEERELRPTPEHLTGLYFYILETDKIDDLDPDDAEWVLGLAKRPDLEKSINAAKIEE